MNINCKGKLIDLGRPKVMGILNLTPDSFYDGGKYKDSTLVLQQVEKMLNEGATFIDVGAYSSRPGADFVSEDEEKQRLLPILEILLKTFPEILISVDTFRSKIARASIERGASIINDISAGKLDEDMLSVIAKYKVPYIMMHMRGTPKTMQSKTSYTNLVKEVILYFSEQLAKARELGIHDIIIDPGFGFSKTLDQNYELLGQLDLLKTLKLPILSGISRKSMIYKTLNVTPDQALNGTSALHMFALIKGTKILRVHDVKEAVECIELAKKLM